MAQLLEPLPDPTHQSRLVKVQLRSQPDLPDHILGQVQWLSFSEHLGYYLWNENTNYPVEFLENYWYYIYRYNGNSYISHEDHIEPYSHNTGYWRITDPEHPEHISEELPLVAGPSTLTVPRRRAETLESVELSPFQTAPNPEHDHSDPEDEYYEPQTSTTEQATDVLAAQFQHVLDLEDREPENPLTPQVPAYLHLVLQSTLFFAWTFPWSRDHTPPRRQTTSAQGLVTHYIPQCYATQPHEQATTPYESTC